jgi:two-component system, cell cycle sensor histidine kinase and response regulator CckA
LISNFRAMSKTLGPLKTVLLADDAAMLREMLRGFLQSMNFRVIEASDAAEAIRISRSHAGKIDLLLTDLEMRGNSGWDAATEIASFRPSMRIVFMSGGINLLDWHDHHEKPPGSHFIQKPFRLEELRALLTAIFPE